MSGRELGVEQARKILGNLVDDAVVDGTVTYLTRRGRRFAAIVPLELVPQGEDDTDPSGESWTAPADVDRDELFEAVEDLVLATDIPGLPADITRPAGALAWTWDDQAGDGPIEGLAAAAWAVVQAVGRHTGTVPHRLTAACAVTETVLKPK